MQNRKLENLELRLRGESPAFRPENGNYWAPETASSRANARNVGSFPQSLPTRQNKWSAWLGLKDSNRRMAISVQFDMLRHGVDLLALGSRFATSSPVS